MCVYVYYQNKISPRDITKKVMLEIILDFVNFFQQKKIQVSIIRSFEENGEASRFKFSPITI